MSIIFLDVDGVLNSINNLIKVYNETHKPYSGYKYPFDEICMKNLKRLVCETHSKLVITSTWRKDEEEIKTLLNKLKEYELDREVIGCTPILNKTRGEEIKAYLKQRKVKENFIILDDDSDFGDLMPFLILTSARDGLTINDTKKAIERLKVLKNKDNEIEL